MHLVGFYCFIFFLFGLVIVIVQRMVLFMFVCFHGAVFVDDGLTRDVSRVRVILLLRFI